MFSGSPKNIFVVTQSLIAIGLIGLFYHVWTHQYFFIALGIFLGWAFLQISYQVALHRYFSHRSFETSKFWHVLLCFSTVLAGVTPNYYATVHPPHHAFSDSDKDPHSPKLGIWKMLLIHLYGAKRGNSQTNHRDFWIQFTVKWYAFIVLIFCAYLLLINTNLLFSYGIALWFTKLFGFIINYTAHLARFPGNYRNFDTNDQSHNNLFTGIILGEWHNNHHHRPQDWNQKVRWWELDIPTNIIRVIKK